MVQVIDPRLMFFKCPSVQGPTNLLSDFIFLFPPAYVQTCVALWHLVEHHEIQEVELNVSLAKSMGLFLNMFLFSYDSLCLPKIQRIGIF